MQWITKQKVATRLAIGFGIILVLTGLLGAFSIVQLGRVNQTSTEMEVNWLPSTRAAGDLNTATSDFRVAELQHVLSTDEAGMTKYEKELADLKRDLDANIAAGGKLFSTAQEQRIFAQFKSSWAEYLAEHDKIIALSRANRNDEAKELARGKAQKEFTEACADLTKLSDINEAGGIASSKRGDELYDNARLAIVVMLGLALASGVAMAALISRTLVRQLGGEPGYAAAVASRIAAGDLSEPVAVRDGDRNSMMFAIQQMRDSLVRIVSDVRVGTDTIATASGEIATGSLDLSSRTEEQASALEETASSMEELTSTVRQSADNARQANALAASASEVASKGGAVVSQVVETMGSINASSQKIADIISVIDGIAFQTNILALNAAVEAARAGEQGRGFAVVASEVRNLAQRSAAAAKEIKLLIEDSVGKVDMGSRLVDQAGSTMQEIVDSIRRVTDIMGEIMSASQEQSAGIEQINEAVVQMDQVTQQNAALVEEASAASQSMQEEAAKLARIVSVFELGAAARRAPAGAVPVAASVATPSAPKRLPAAPRKQPAAQPAAARGKEPVNAAADGWETF